MKALRFNHVSVHATDLEESTRFYEELFGMKRVPEPDFPGVVVVWLELGDQQLHLFHRPVDAPFAHHFGLDVDDFAGVYRRAKERGLLDGSAQNGVAIRSHPAGWVQMYIRDPAGNLVEIDCPDIEALPADIQAEIPSLDDAVVQAGEHRIATIYS